MSLVVERMDIADVLLIKPRVLRDGRGRFLETWRAADYAAAGVPDSFAQDSISVSAGNVLRGLHFQHPGGQGKLISVLRGRVFDVAVDIRLDSPTFARWVGVELSEESGWQLWIPPGFAHGFAVLSDDAMVGYKCSAYYAPQHEHTILWNDPALAIRWPLPSPQVSPKDGSAPRLAEVPQGELPVVTDYSA